MESIFEEYEIHLPEERESSKFNVSEIFTDFPIQDLFDYYLNKLKTPSSERDEEDKPIIEEPKKDINEKIDTLKLKPKREYKLPKKMSNERKALVEEMRRQGFTDEEVEYYDKLAGKESGWKTSAKATGKHSTGKPYTARGYFQFLDTTAKQYGLNPEKMTIAEQVAAVKKFTEDNYRRLKKYEDTSNYSKWGLVGGAHLGGVGGVKRYLEKGKNTSDKFGTTVKGYLDYFN